MKICNKCNVIKSFEDFYKQKKGKFGLCGRCKECMQAYYNKRYSENPDKIRAIQKKYYDNNPTAKRNTMLKYYYKLSREEYDILLMKQNNSCGICKTHINDLNRDFDVDHSHETNKIRGLLCPKCNKGMGLFNDDVKLLENCLKYLKNAYIE